MGLVNPVYFKKDGTVYKLSGMTVGNDYPEIYSLDEREVGVWIDGKPLYQKSFEGSLTPSQSSVSNVIFDATDYDIERVVEADGYIIETNTGYYLQLGCYLNGGHNSSWYSQGNGTFLIYHTGEYNHYVITIYYTKTTDTPGSGKWSNNGSPAHHYSTSEQVVGTWIDGKPIYEKTYYIESLPNNTTLQIETLVNINRVISFQGFCSYTLSDGYFRPIPLPDGNNDIRADVTDNVLQIKTTTNWSQYEGYLTIQYTKTTD